MVKVTMTANAKEQFEKLPLSIIGRVAAIIESLANYPAVSGAKRLRHNLKGKFRKRTGDYRIVFSVKGDRLTIEQIEHRKDVYDD